MAIKAPGNVPYTLSVVLTPRPFSLENGHNLWNLRNPDDCVYQAIPPVVSEFLPHSFTKDP
ncbi:MAG TPA: hypothetical protein VER14_04625 [Phototrophicaceae bacterium]|nr:hypothetical protein [Phototrophicaceae bacterium]